MPSKRRSDEVTVELIAGHRHAGRDCAAGETVTVRRRLLPTLEAMGVIAPGAGDSAGAATAGEGEASAPAGTLDASADADGESAGAPDAEDSPDGAAPDGHD